mgnify:CR=1 FL=1
MKTTLLVAAIAALSSALPAQFVFPSAYAGTLGNAVMNAPFTALTGQPTGSTRCMVVMDPTAVPFPVGTVLTQVAFRRDGAYPSTAYGGFTGNLTVRMGSVIAVPDAVQDVRFARLWNGKIGRAHV